MFDFLRSEEKKIRRHAANWLEVAERVYHFRRDQLTDAQHQQLQGAREELQLRLKEKADTGKLKLGIEKLEAVLVKTGGRHYPATSMVENVEFFLVAAIVILGLRAYFVQPFKIPTNSMWPTYYGMTHELFKEGEEPGVLARAGRFLAFGASNYSVKAAADGEGSIAVAQVGPSRFVILGSEKQGRMFGVFPTLQHEYVFSTGDERTTLSVPVDFNFDYVMAAKLGLKDREQLNDYFASYIRQNPESSVLTVTREGQRLNARVYWVPITGHLNRGDKIISFDILTGDLLFVDRFTYNFFSPKVGQGFVFKTDNIRSPYMEKPYGTQIKQYYIKRLVGTPGDTLEVKSPALWRNGQPITGAEAFNRNAQREGKYRGYTNIEKLQAGDQVTIPAHDYFAMGDNSPDSADSRYWGFVPEKDVVGRPLFIYYPLTKRWGPAQ